MKSYVLENIDDAAVLSAKMDELLPGQQHPWLLLHASGDVMAYFYIDDDLSSIVADLSGRHYNSDAEILSVLRSVREKAGGVITNDNDEVILD